MPDLKKQIAVVTGASGGIGGAIATAFIQGGAHVVAVGRDIAKLEALVTRLRGLAGIAEAFRADLTQDDDLSGLAEYVSYTSGRLDILVHSAGLYAKGRPYQPELLLQPEDVASVVCNAVTLAWTAEVTDITIRPMQKSY